jgi:putative DNA primase/helicase
MRDGGELHSLQFIGPDGGKRFLAGGRVIGCYFAIGNPKRAAALCITEGFATGATIFEATNYPVAVAFNAGNLEAVSRALRAKFPAINLILCADDDAATDGNPGLTKATAAALAVGGKLAVPDFGTDRPDGATDFNDMAALRGAESVAKTVAEAQAIKASPIGVVYRRFSDVKAKPIRWLWPGRIACGKLTVIAGNPGLGKSQLTASLAAIVSHGELWPVENSRCEPGGVVILSAEDDAEDTIRPRLEAAGADLQRCYMLDAVCDVDEKGKPYQRAFSLKRDLERLSSLLAELKNVRLVVVDPISAYLGDADSHKNAEIRALLAPLGDLAAKHGAAVVAVSHFNKAGQQDALLRVMGSLAFVAAARAAYAVVKYQNDPQRRLFLPLKNNLGRDMIGYAFTVETVTLADDIETSRINWEQEAVTITAEEAMTPLGDAEERSEIEDAKAFLENLLADGPVSSKPIRADAEGAGYSWATIRRAQKALGIVPAKEGMKGPWLWKLPPKVLNDAEDAHSKKLSTFDENEHLRQADSGWEDV